MGDRRSDATRMVYRHLRGAAFRECLSVSDGQGGRPIVVALPTDAMQTVLAQVTAAGGRCNVVVSRPTDLLVLGMVSDVSDDGDGPEVPRLGTVAEFLSAVIAEPDDHQRTRPISVPVGVPC